MDIKELIKEVRSANPYTLDVFKPIEKKDWEAFHAALREKGISADAYMAHMGRLSWDNCCTLMEVYLKNPGGEDDGP